MKIDKKLTLSALIWCLCLLTALANPVDSLIAESANKFAAFVKKNQTNGTKNTKNPYIFSFDPVRDGTQPSIFKEYLDSPTNIFDDNATHLGQVATKLAAFNNSYDVTSQATGDPIKNLEVYVFHGRYYVNSSQIYIGNGLSGSGSSIFMNDGSSEQSKIDILKSTTYGLKTTSEYLYKHVEERVSQAIGVNNRRIIIIYAIEIKNISYEVQKEQNGSVARFLMPIPKILKKVFYRPYRTSVSEIDILDNVFYKYTPNIQIQDLNGNIAQASIVPNDLVGKLLGSVTVITDALNFLKIRNELDNTCDTDVIANLLLPFNTNDKKSLFAELTVGQKVKYLSLLVQKPLLNGRESLANNIINETSSQDDAEALLTELEKSVDTGSSPTGACPNTMITYALIERLIYRIQDGGVLTDNNYTYLIKVITSLVQRGSGYNARYTKYLDYNYALKSITYGGSLTERVGFTRTKNCSINPNGTVVFTVEQITGFTNVNIPNPATTTVYTGGGSTITSKTPLWQDLPTITPALKPFDLIAFKNESGLSIIDRGLNTNVLVPAIFMKYAHDKKWNNDVATNSVFIALDILTIAKGVPAFTAANRLHRAFIALEVLNATGNIALNLASSQLSGTPFETLVHNTDMMLLGFGIKNIAKDALPAMYNLAKNGDGIVNAQSVKMFLASFFSIETSVRTAALSGDVGAKNISAVADAVIADVKNHPNGNTLIAEAKTFIGITRFNAYNLGNLGVKGISKRGTIEISGIAFNDADNIVDVIIHAKGTGYSLWIDKVEQVITEADLATLLGNIPSGKIIRLLSCSNLNSAKELSKLLPNEIHAIEDLVRIHPDGGVTTIARSGNATQKWRKLKVGVDIGEAPTPITPTGSAVGRFVRMGSSTKITSTPTTMAHEIDQAEIIGDYLGGGEFQFIDSKQGIEGFFRNGVDEIPISLKQYSTDNIKNIFRRIKDNADKIEVESVSDPKIIIGITPNSIIYVESTVFTEQQILAHIANNSDNILPSKSVFSKVILKSTDNKFITIPLK